MDYSYYEMMDMPDSDVPVKILSSFFYGKNKGFTSHWHEHTEILCDFEGSGEMSCGNISFNFEPGDIVFVNSSEIHSLISLSDTLKYKVIICDLKKLVGNKKINKSDLSELLASNLVVFTNKITGNNDFKMTLDRLKDEYERRDFGYDLEIRSLLFHFFSTLSRKYTKSILSVNEYKNKKITMGKIGSIFAYIDLNYSKPVSSALCAEMLNFSHSHFCHAFRNVTGKTFVEYLNDVRILKSVNLLMDTSLNMTQIAFETGFNDPGYYTRIFRRKIGTTPSKYRMLLTPSTQVFL